MSEIHVVDLNNKSIPDTYGQSESMNRSRKAQGNNAGRAKAVPSNKVPKKAKTPDRKQVMRVARSISPKLSAEARAYMHALADPKNATPTGIPTAFPLVPSFKGRCWAVGTLSIGTGGYGFLQVGAERTVINDATSVYSSSSAYALTTLPSSYVETGVVSVATNSNFSAAQLGSSTTTTQVRLVACAATVQYTGTELDLSGEVTALRHPDHVSLTGAMTRAQMLAYPNAQTMPLTSARRVARLTWMPISADEVEYKEENTTAPLSMAFLISGVAASTYHYEVFCIYEAIGVNIPTRSANLPDPNGLAAVIGAAENEDSSWSGTAKSLLSNLTNYAIAELGAMSGATARTYLSNSVKAMMNGQPDLPAINGVTVEDLYDELVGPRSGTDAAPVIPDCPWATLRSNLLNKVWIAVVLEPHIIVRIDQFDYQVHMLPNHICAFAPLSAVPAVYANKPTLTRR
jgi:hypothetical protein